MLSHGKELISPIHHSVSECPILDVLLLLSLDGIEMHGYPPEYAWWMEHRHGSRVGEWMT